jgi:hypothetical protein
LSVAHVGRHVDATARPLKSRDEVTPGRENDRVMRGRDSALGHELRPPPVALGAIDPNLRRGRGVRRGRNALPEAAIRPNRRRSGYAGAALTVALCVPVAGWGMSQPRYAPQEYALGAVINFNSGDYTLTHSAGLLTASGALTVGGALTASGIIELGDAADTSLSPP